MWEDRIVGQEAILQSLRKSLSEDTLSHAILFTGSFGYGALPVALALAQDMLCISPQDGKACGHCKACKQSSQLIHPDLHMAYPVVGTGKTERKNVTSDSYIVQWREQVELNPYLSLDDWIGAIAQKTANSDINVTECDNIYQRLRMMSYSSSRRIQFIWKAEQLGLNGNKLLKLIEEPTPGTFIFLFCENKDQVLNTIVSRCRDIRLSPIKDSDISEYLQAKMSLSPTDAKKVSFLAEGDFAQAIDFVNVSEVELVAQVREFIEASMSRDYVRMKSWSDEFHKYDQRRKRAILMYYLKLLRELLHMKAVGEHHGRLSEEDKRMVKSIKPFYTLRSGQIDSLQQYISSVIDLLHRNVHSRILMFNTCLKIDGVTHMKEAIALDPFA